MKGYRSWLVEVDSKWSWLETKSSNGVWVKVWKITWSLHWEGTRIFFFIWWIRLVAERVLLEAIGKQWPSKRKSTH